MMARFLSNIAYFVAGGWFGVGIMCCMFASSKADATAEKQAQKERENEE